MSEQMNFSNASMALLNVLNKIKTIQFGGLDLQPEYQRGYIWKSDFKDKLIFSIIKQYPTGNISIRVLQSPNAKGAKEEVVDGQQRLTTIKSFVLNEYVIKSEWSRKIIELIVLYMKDYPDEKLEKLKKKLNKPGNIRLKYDDLPSVIQDNINAYNIPVTYIANASDVQIREYFRFLQNQERLRAGEIIKSMPATNLEQYINKITDKDKFLDVIGFSDNRAEFDKVFYSIVGLLDEKINFGVSDKIIQNYAGNAETPQKGIPFIMNMIKQINKVSNQDDIIVELSRKRFLKFFLLLASLGNVDFSTETTKKIKTLKLIDDKLASFFSAKLDAVDNEFAGMSTNVIEEFRNIALITKGGHALQRVKNRMQVLAHYVNNGIDSDYSGIDII